MRTVVIKLVPSLFFVCTSAVTGDPLDTWYWRSPTPNPQVIYQAIVFGKGMFVAAGNGVITSPDGIVWRPE